MSLSILGCTMCVKRQSGSPSFWPMTEVPVVQAKMSELFPGYEGLAGLYVIEDGYREQAVVQLAAGASTTT